MMPALSRRSALRFASLRPSGLSARNVASVAGSSNAPRSPGAPGDGVRHRFAWWVVACLAIMLFCSAPPTWAQARGAGTADGPFEGVYVGVDVGSFNYFGGSFVGGVDVLAQETKTVTDLFVGWRTQWLGNRLLTGLRLDYGLVDGDLSHSEPGLDILYENDSQLGYGGEIGWVLGRQRPWALVVYAYETQREFDVTITTPFGSFGQTDKQTLTRVGLGAEVVLRGDLHLRASVGRIFVDFGDLVTNIEVDDELDAAVGIAYQF